VIHGRTGLPARDAEAPVASRMKYETPSSWRFCPGRTRKRYITLDDPRGFVEVVQAFLRT
jgi:hypothetical protein